jgi:hypothetical protein
MERNVMGTTPRRTPPAKRPANDGELAVLEHDDNPDEPNRVQPDRWRGDGVVGDNHTD